MNDLIKTDKAISVHPIQAAGHGYLRLGSAGTVKKPSLKNEVWTYNEIFKPDGVMRALAPFVPAYHGVVRDDSDGTECILMDDLTHGFELPCAVDIKIGLIQHNRTMSEEKIKKMIETIFSKCRFKFFSILTSSCRSDQ